MEMNPSVRRDYASAVLAVSVAVLVRALVDPLLGYNLPFYLFYFAVIASVALGGMGPGFAALGLGFVVASYFFMAPRYSLDFVSSEDVLGAFRYLSLGAVIVVGGGWVRSRLQQVKLEARQRKQEETVARQQLEHTYRTLASIGDGLIATDTHGNVTFMNGEAEKLSGWRLGEAQGKAIDQVFNIVNLHTRQPVPNPCMAALREGSAMTIPEHTSLVDREGTDHLIDDTAAPIRDADHNIIGSVLVFRKVQAKQDFFSVHAVHLHAGDGAQLPLDRGVQQALERTCREWLYREWKPNSRAVRFVTLNGFDLIVREEDAEHLPSGALGITFQVAYTRAEKAG